MARHYKHGPARSQEALLPQQKNGIERTRYSRPASQCQNGPLKAVCLPASGAPRSIYRSEHAEVVEAHRQRMAEQGAKKMRQRAGVVEHPFGTLKRWFGWVHFTILPRSLKCEV